MQNVQQELEKCVTKEQIKTNEPMSKHTTFQIGGNADYYVTVKNMQEAQSIVTVAKKYELPITYLGNGSNILVRDEGVRGIVLKNAIGTVEIEENTMIVGAGVTIAAAAFLAYEKGLTGLEFASGIPGTVGGAIKMNAGAHGSEMKNVLQEVSFLDEQGNVVTKQAADLDLSYRHSFFCKQGKCMILQAKLQLQKGDKKEIKEKMEEYAAYRKESQPIGMPSAGSSFKRGNGFITARLIDECGLKGYHIGGAQISTKHAGFIVNTGGATCEDVLDLVEHVKKVVYEKCQKEIELEFDIVG